MTSLLSLRVPQELLEGARRAFDAFFQRYPYCYGYWRKYAELERRLGSARSAQQVGRAFLGFGGGGKFPFFLGFAGAKSPFYWGLWAGNSHF